jgi:CubicO group peptidase (beta-lactamase class C family)
MRKQILALITALVASTPVLGQPADLETVVEDVVSRHMAEKQIPGLSVAVVQGGDVVFSGGYGHASVEFDVPATPATVYPISSVSKIFAGLLAVRLAEEGKLDLDASIADFFARTPRDKESITVRHLLQHTHGLEDSYRSETYAESTGKTFKDSTVPELARWSLQQQLRFEPGTDWEYSLIGYVMLAQIMEISGGEGYESLLDAHVFEPLDMNVTFGGTEAVIAGRNSVLYELINGEVSGRHVDFPRKTYAAGGANTSVDELAKLFRALRGDAYMDDSAKALLWKNTELPSGKSTHYGLGWFSYETSMERWVVGHEGGGASWVIYYPELDVAVIALSNMSGARADNLPFEIAREAFAANLLPAN